MDADNRVSVAGKPSLRRCGAGVRKPAERLRFYSRSTDNDLAHSAVLKLQLTAAAV